METRQSAKRGQTTHAITSTVMLDSSASGATESFPTPDMYQDPLRTPGGGWRRDVTDIPSDFSIQQMHALEPIQWKGGDKFYDGPHDDFCFVCGSTMELFGCQTCENCYHAQCMTPSLGINDVPTFWFCPHCVERELHIPPMSPVTNYFTPVSPPAPVYPSPHSPQIEKEKRSAANNHTIIPPPPSISTLESSGHNARRARDGQSIELSKETQMRNESTENPKSAPKTTSSDYLETHPKRSKSTRRRRSYSPPRKKSKYSAFSAEVDKALSVLYSELETAAQVGKSEGHLESKVRDLEQRLKLQEQQMLLKDQEIDAVRMKLEKERELYGSVQNGNGHLREEIARLKEGLRSKDNELRDWRAKLKGLLGSEVE